MKKFLFLILITLSFNFVSSQEKKITLEDLWQRYTFFPSGVYGLRSMNDGETYTVFEKRKDIIKFSYKSGELLDTIFKVSDFNLKNISDYEFSKDENKILLTTDVAQIYRHSFSADYFIFDRKKNKLELLSKNGKQQLATFSPDGTKISFVRDNNLFIKDLETNEETQITKDGKHNEIINGAPDWVYEEEFAFSKAFDWSEDGKKLAFYRFDESNVKEFKMMTYNEGLYPEWYKFKYPKAGEDNSVVSIFVYNLETKKSVKIDIGKEKDQYIPRIKFTKEANILSIIRMNRLQNKFEILLANAKDGTSKVIYTETNEKYVREPSDNTITFLNDKEHFILLSEKDGFYHIYLYKTDGTFIRQLTKGNWEVTKFIGYDEKKKFLYYQASKKSPLEREIYAVDINGKKVKEISIKKGTNKVTFSKSFRYFINDFSNANTPSYITLNENLKRKTKEIRVLEDNSALIKKMKDYGFSKKEFLKIKTKDAELNAYIIKPLDFDKTKKYPVFMFLYGGPRSQQVSNSFDFYNMMWFQMLTQKGYIVACVDNRGTGYRGQDFTKITYKELGKYETIDQIESAKYFASLSYIDGNRIGIFGWSYGGYMSSSCLFKGNDVFKMAIAVAPVTNWRYYDNIYTERYMAKPQDNSFSYDDNSPINHVHKLKGKFLLIHGMGDDNVHFQNSVELSEKLVQANKQFTEHFYRNRNHSIYGGNTRMHLYRLMTDFILENL